MLAIKIYESDCQHVYTNDRWQCTNCNLKQKGLQLACIKYLQWEQFLYHPDNLHYGLGYLGRIQLKVWLIHTEHFHRNLLTFHCLCTCVMCVVSYSSHDSDFQVHSGDTAQCGELPAPAAPTPAAPCRPGPAHPSVRAPPYRPYRYPAGRPPRVVLPTTPAHPPLPPPLRRDRMALPLMPAPFEKRRVARRPRTAASGSDFSHDGDMEMGLPAALGGRGELPTGSTMHGRNRNSSMPGYGRGAPQSTAWGTNDDQGSDTDLEDEGRGLVVLLSLNIICKSNVHACCIHCK